MKSIRQRPPSEEWNVSSTNALIDQLRSLRESMLGAPQRFDGWLRAVDPAHEDSATNLGITWRCAEPICASYNSTSP
jgi:hypothetical protein